MATSVKYQNISVQPSTVPRTARAVYELPRQNLTEAELSRKSTSDRTKRRVAHKARYPLPVITKPAVVEKPPRKQIKKLMFKKDGTVSRVTILESRKSTSDSTKRRVTHEPEVTKTAAEKAQQKQIQKPVLNKDGTVSRMTPFKGRKSTSDSTKRGVSQMPVISKPAAVVAGKPLQKQIKKVLLKKDETVSRVTKFEGRKSNSDSTKRRMAHVPEVTKTAAIVAEKAQQNQIKKLVLKKNGGTWSVKPREVKQTTQRVVVDSARAEHSRSSSSGVDDRVTAYKKKSEGLGVDGVFVNKQEKGVDDRPKADKRVSEGSSFDEVFTKKQKQGVDDRPKADKRVSEGSSFDEVFTKKQKQGVDDRVKPDKIKSGDLGVFTFF